MKRRFMLGTFVAALVAAAPASAITRDEVAKKHAPVFYQEVRDKTRDLYTAYDFDGNWAGDDNEENVACVADATNGSIHVDAQGLPQVYSQQVGHGLCGGFSPPNNLFPDLQLTCNHGEAPHIAGTGIVYRPDLAAAQPVVADGKAVDAGYAMVEIF